jgi:hypothetical protein
MVKNLLSVMARSSWLGTRSPRIVHSQRVRRHETCESDRHRQASGVGKSSHLVLRRRQG